MHKKFDLPCITCVDHVDSFKILYNLLPEVVLQWIGRTMSKKSNNRDGGVGYLSFLIRDKPNAIDKIPNKYHHKCMGIAVDTSSEQNVKIALSKTIQHFKKVDILINAVGGNSGKSSFINLDIN